MFKNFNSQNLLIGIIIVFIVFIFLSRENFYTITTVPTPPNKICPGNSELKNDICEFPSSIPRRRSVFGPLPCPYAYEPSSRTSCRPIYSTTLPKLECNHGSELIEGMCYKMNN
jgi:hypothetical protein